MSQEGRKSHYFQNKAAISNLNYNPASYSLQEGVRRDAETLSVSQLMLITHMKKMKCLVKQGLNPTMTTHKLRKDEEAYNNVVACVAKKLSKKNLQPLTTYGHPSSTSSDPSDVAEFGLRMVMLSELERVDLEKFRQEIEAFRSDVGMDPFPKYF